MLHDVTIDDMLESISAIECDWSASPADNVMALGDTMTGTATYAITDDDIDIGKVTNIATAHGLDLNGNTVTSDEAIAETTLSRAVPLMQMSSDMKGNITITIFCALMTISGIVLAIRKICND